MDASPLPADINFEVFVDRFLSSVWFEFLAFKVPQFLQYWVQKQSLLLLSLPIRFTTSKFWFSLSCSVKNKEELSSFKNYAESSNNHIYIKPKWPILNIIEIKFCFLIKTEGISSENLCISCNSGFDAE